MNKADNQPVSRPIATLRWMPTLALSVLLINGISQAAYGQEHPSRQATAAQSDRTTPTHEAEFHELGQQRERRMIELHENRKAAARQVKTGGQKPLELLAKIETLQLQIDQINDRMRQLAIQHGLSMPVEPRFLPAKNNPIRQCQGFLRTIDFTRFLERS